MSNLLEVSQKSVEDLLKTGSKNPFVIPEYQRPYEWDYEQIEVLFEDLWDFAGSCSDEQTYFLGSVISYNIEDTDLLDSKKKLVVQHIIDGQQRITSLFLLLRAIYTKLASLEKKTKEIENFISEIGCVIWETEKFTGEINFNKSLLTSQVINNDGNEILRNILKAGVADKYAVDHYSKNYLYFQKLIDDKLEINTLNPLPFYEFIYVLLKQTVLLVISANSLDSALTIFSTLNDRGLPLSDTDIFKAKIYNHLKNSEKNKFIDDWKELQQRVSDANESVWNIFYYYMFYLRAKEQDNKTTTPGLRNFYSENKFKRLWDPDLIGDLIKLSNLCKVINVGTSLEDEVWSQDNRIRKALDILLSYPNDYWKYPVVIFYLKYKYDHNFGEKFKVFLYKLIRELVLKFLLRPTVTAIKPDVNKLDVALFKCDHPSFEFKIDNSVKIEDVIVLPNYKMTSLLLKILAYEQQEELLPKNW